jgi:endonuclease III
MRAPMTPLAVIKGLEKTYPLFKTALAYKTDWQLLFAVSLSAQTTDANVNRATAVLFTELPSIEAIANAPIAKLEKFVHSVGYYQTKAKNLKAAAKQLLSEYNGRVPALWKNLLHFLVLVVKQRMCSCMSGTIALKEWLSTHTSFV